MQFCSGGIVIREKSNSLLDPQGPLCKIAVLSTSIEMWKVAVAWHFRVGVYTASNIEHLREVVRLCRL